MKDFFEPEVEILVLEASDVITTSGGIDDADGGDNAFPFTPVG